MIFVKYRIKSYEETSLRKYFKTRENVPNKWVAWISKERGTFVCSSKCIKDVFYLPLFYLPKA